MRMDQKSKDLGYHPMIRTFSTQISRLDLTKNTSAARSAPLPFINTFIKQSRYIGLFATLLVSIGWASTETQPTGPDSQPVFLERMMNALRDNAPSRMHPERLVKIYGYNIVPFAEKYIRDPNTNVRSHAYMIIRSAGMNSRNVLERQGAVDKLFVGLEDDRFGGSIASNLLASFQAADYSDAAKKILHDKLVSSPTFRLILLVGAADMKSELPMLKEIVDNETSLESWISHSKSHRLARAALMARARMGVKEDIKRCIDLVELHPDEEYRVTTLLEKLSYVRQPEVVEYIGKHCCSTKVESGSPRQLKMTYGSRAISALSKMLRNFPHPPFEKIFKSETEYVKYHCEWIKKQKTWDIIR